MLNSRTKDKIYALLSFLVIVLIIGSFAFTVNFLVGINKYIFDVDEKSVREKTTAVDKTGFEIIKTKLNLIENKHPEVPRAENTPVISPLLNDVLVPVSPNPSFSPISSSSLDVIEEKAASSASPEK